MEESENRNDIEPISNNKFDGSSLVGLLLGFCLPIFGLLIAIRGKKENTIQGALVGLVLFVICFAIFIILLQCNAIRLGPPPVAD